MATRFYLTNAAPDVTAAGTSGNWDTTSGIVSKALSTAKSGTATSIGIAETSKTNNWDVLLGRFVSPPMTAAGTLQGSVTITVAGLQSNSAAGDNPRVVVYVVSNDGGTVRGELADVSGSAWPTSAAGVQLVASSTTPVACSYGDRIVVEYGYTAVNTSSTSYTGTIYYGGTDATDLTSGDTNTAHPSWIEFADDGLVQLFDPNNPTPGAPTTPVFQSASGANQGDGTSMAVNVPSPIGQGDLLIAFQGQDADGTSVNDLTNTSGSFTLLGSQAGGTSSSRSPWAKVWRKIASASEGSSYTFGDSTNSNHGVVIVAFKAGTFDPNNPIAAGPTWQSSQGSGNSTSHVAPSVAGVAGGVLLCGFMADTAGTISSYTPPGDMTELQETSFEYIDISACMKVLTSSGATGTETATNTKSSGRTCVSLVINPAPGGITPIPLGQFFAAMGAI